MVAHASLAGSTALLVAPYSWPAGLLVVAIALWMVRLERKARP